MTKIFKKLFIGDTVKIIGNKVFKKLTTEKPQDEPQDDSIVGIWRFNSTITNISSLGDYYIDFTYNNETTVENCMSFNVDQLWFKNPLSFVAYGFTNNNWHNNFNGEPPIIKILGGGDINNPTFIQWLIHNATKVDDIIGVWKFNNTINLTYENGSNVSVNINYKTTTGYNGTQIKSNYVSGYSNKCLIYELTGVGGVPVYENSWGNELDRTITIIGGTDIYNETFITWLKANATKL